QRSPCRDRQGNREEGLLSAADFHLWFDSDARTDDDNRSGVPIDKSEDYVLQWLDSRNPKVCRADLAAEVISNVAFQTGNRRKIQTLIINFKVNILGSCPECWAKQ